MLPIDTYLRVCEELGEEPDPDKMPPDRSEFPIEVQEAFTIHDLLPDRWEGMSGSYLGKDYSALGTMLKEFNVKERQLCIVFLKHIEARNSQTINKDLERKRKSSKNKGGNAVK
tara:strand:+ start:1175 stop:1516 length:342 start_codon:yes stop_codon:yes gene_type:complete